eukprot:1749688-Amphidinium_carterae.1
MRASKRDLQLGRGLLSNTSRNKERNLRVSGKLCCLGSLPVISKGVWKPSSERSYDTNTLVER